MRLILILILCFIMVGCASSKKIYTQDGEPGFALNCSGTARSWDDCYEKAGKLCGTRGYTIIDRNTEHNSTATGYASANNFYGSSQFYGSTYQNRTMVIKCKKP